MPNSGAEDFRRFKLSDGAVIYRTLPGTGKCDRLNLNTPVLFLRASHKTRMPRTRGKATSFQLRPVTILSPEKELSPFSHFGAKKRVLGVSRTTHCHSNGFLPQWLGMLLYRDPDGRDKARSRKNRPVGKWS
jgi:hypothetical protein